MSVYNVQGTVIMEGSSGATDYMTLQGMNGNAELNGRGGDDYYALPGSGITTVVLTNGEIGTPRLVQFDYYDDDDFLKLVKSQPGKYQYAQEQA